LQKFLMVTAAADEMVLRAPPGSNVQERLKELYSLAGYRDGSRFVSENVDPRLAKSMQMIKELTEQLKGKQLEIASGERTEQQKLISSERQKDKELQVDYERIRGDLQIRAAELLIEQQRLELEKLQLQLEARGADLDLQKSALELQGKSKEIDAKLTEAQLKLEGEHQKIAGQAMKIAADIEKAQLDLEKAKTDRDNEVKLGAATDKVAGLGSEIEGIKKSLEDAKVGMKSINLDVKSLGVGMNAMLLDKSSPKKKPTKFTLKKQNGKKTNKVVVGYDDGTEQEITVGEAAS
jgi:hypothetical protein